MHTLIMEACFKHHVDILYYESVVSLKQRMHTNYFLKIKCVLTISASINNTQSLTSVNFLLPAIESMTR